MGSAPLGSRRSKGTKTSKSKITIMSKSMSKRCGIL